MPANKKPAAPAKKPNASVQKVEKTVKDVEVKVEKKVQEVKKQVADEVEFVKGESKELASGIGRWWESASGEEKAYTILGIIALLLGLYVLRNMIGGLILIIIGILFVTGYFVKKGK